MKLRTSRRGGFTLVEIMIVVAIIGLLAAIALPNFVRARTTAHRNVCINNLRQIDSAKHQWALEAGKVDSDTPDEGNLQPYMRSDLYPVCPIGGGYTIGSMAETPGCAYSAAPQEHVLPMP